MMHDSISILAAQSFPNNNQKVAIDRRLIEKKKKLTTLHVLIDVVVNCCSENGETLQQKCAKME